MTLKGALKMVMAAIKDFDADNASTLAAALAFYTTLSLAPLLLILLFVMGFIGPSAQEQLIQEVQNLMGTEAGSVIRVIIDNAHQQRQAGWLSGIIGIATLLFSATAVFGQLQMSMNRVWNVEVRPMRNILWEWLKTRLLSLGMVAGIGFLLLVSLTVTTALHLVLGSGGWLWILLDNAISLAVYTIAFAMIFKVLPDVKIAWHDVSFGAALTALLFVVGKWAIGKYLGYSSIASAYGAAGSLVVLLLWVYYSSLIVLFGAELAQAYARARGVRLKPEILAVKDPVAEQKKSPLKPTDLNAK